MLFNFLSLTNSIQKGTNCYKLNNQKQEKTLTVYTLINNAMDGIMVIFTNYQYIHAEGNLLQITKAITFRYNWIGNDIIDGSLSEATHVRLTLKPFSILMSQYIPTDMCLHIQTERQLFHCDKFHCCQKNRHQQQHLSHQVMENIKPLAKGTPDSILL